MNIFYKFQVSYIVAIGIVDKLSGYCHSIRDPIDNKPDVAEFLLSSFQFLSSITGLVEVLSSQDQDPTHLWKAYEVTDLAGTVELLYGKYNGKILFGKTKHFFFDFYTKTVVVT